MAKYPLVGPSQIKITVGEADAEGGKTFHQQVSPIIAPEDSEVSSLTPNSFQDYVETVVAPSMEAFAEAFGGTVEILNVDPKCMTISYRATGGALEMLEQKIAEVEKSTGTHSR